MKSLKDNSTDWDMKISWQRAYLTQHVKIGETKPRKKNSGRLLKKNSQSEKDRIKMTSKEGVFTANSAARTDNETYIKESVKKEIGNFLCQEIGKKLS